MTLPEDPTPEPESPRSRWAWVGTAAGVLLGVVLLFGAFAKMLDPAGFAEMLQLDGLDFLIPAEGLVYFALALEIGVGLALMVGVRHTYVMVPAVFLVTLFMFITGRHYYDSLQGTPASHACGCFGNLVERSPAEAFWQDFALLVPTLGLAFVARPVGALPIARLGSVAGATAVGLVFTWFAPDLPIDDFATRLHPDLEVTAICAGKDDGRICLETVVPELIEGEHLVVIADITDPTIYPPLNDYAMAGNGPFLWVLSPLSQRKVNEILDDMLLGQGVEPMFQVVHAPAAVIRPLYRHLPRGFLVQEGRVTRTWAGMPSLADWDENGPATNR